MNVKDAPKHKRNYIGYRIRGHIQIKAKTREEAERLFKEELERRMEEDFPSFYERNLTGVFEEKVLLGVEIKQEYGGQDNMEIKYTNDKDNQNSSRWRKASGKRESRYKK
jgi:hypothetical protein